MEGSTSPNTSASVNVVNSFILSHSSRMHSTSWHGSNWHWGFGYFCPVLQCLGISQSLLQLVQVVVLHAKPHVLQGRVGISVDTMWNWGHGVIIKPLCGMKTCLGHFERCPYPSGKLADISLVEYHYQFWPLHGHSDLLCPPCHPGGGIVKGSASIGFPSALGRVVSPSRKLSNWECREGGYPRSLASGWDQSDGSTVSASSGQDGRGESSDCDWGISLTWVSSKLDSLKVTLLLGQVGLGDGAYLFASFPRWPTTEGVCSYWLIGRHLLWLLVHLLLCECLQLPD